MEKAVELYLKIIKLNIFELNAPTRLNVSSTVEKLFMQKNAKKHFLLFFFATLTFFESQSRRRGKTTTQCQMWQVIPAFVTLCVCLYACVWVCVCVCVCVKGELIHFVTNSDDSNEMNTRVKVLTRENEMFSKWNSLDYNFVDTFFSIWTSFGVVH